MGQMKILLVDDERHFVSALAERLSMRGLEADWACTGRDAMDMALDKDYDLAILDVKMPNISGLDLKRKLAEISPSMRFIFFTGHGSEDEFKVCSAESDCYLVKPLRIEDLLEKIQIVMGHDRGKE